MLVLTRKVGEEIVIGNDVRVTVLGVKGDRVRLGFTAPPEISIWRQELEPEATSTKSNGRVLPPEEEELLVECDCAAEPVFFSPSPGVGSVFH